MNKTTTNPDYITRRLKIADDAFVLPVSELPDDIRIRLGDVQPDSFVLTRPTGRSQSKLLDSQTAQFVALFKEPTHFIDAVIVFCKVTGDDPEKTLDQFWPIVRRLLKARFFSVETDSLPQDSSSLPLLPELIGRWRPVKHIHRSDDTELIEAVKGESVTNNSSLQCGIIKIVRSGAQNTSFTDLKREAEILEYLGGTHTPTVYDRGDFDGRQFVVMSFVRGEQVSNVCHRLRCLPRTHFRRTITRLFVNILSAYESLHSRGVIHADVHPGNILVSDDLAVTIVDFGFARLPGHANRRLNVAKRGGNVFFFDPQFAEALLQVSKPSDASHESEQFALGAMLYYLATGHHYLSFSLSREEALRQIVDQKMRTFADAESDAWPELEAILDRALSKDPANRFPSLSEFVSAIKQVDKDAPLAAHSLKLSTSVISEAQKALSIASSLSKEIFKVPPLSSLTFGAAGLSYALLRIACIQDCPTLLSSADLWINTALQQIGHSGAFYNHELGITADQIGGNSLFHTEIGLQWVSALVSEAMGDMPALGIATQRYASLHAVATENYDVTLGYSGLVLGSASLLSVLSTDGNTIDPSELIACTRKTLSLIWERLAALPTIGTLGEIQFFGIAHGWAGILLASIRWCEVSGDSIPIQLVSRLNELIKCAELSTFGAQWPIRITDAIDRRRYMTGWCNGSAGHVHLWTSAYKLLGDDSYLEIARLCGENAWNPGYRSLNNYSLCCGDAGRAYAFLDLYRTTGAGEWLDRTIEVLESAWKNAKDTRYNPSEHFSLYKGLLGLVLATYDCSDPVRSLTPILH